jgi:alkanesulfonate monooxygenase SsuD/methylene tetrahydromethanopterin reductase-like flavin-dependent oxidoreductase (luciferase family)
VTLASVGQAVRISAHPGQHVEWLTEYAELGFDDIYLHHVGQDQEPFLETFAEHVLPELADAVGTSA